MRRLSAIALALALLPVFACAYTSPGKPVGYISDFAHMLKPETVASLDQELSGFAAQTGAEISVATIPTHGSDETIDSYASALFQEWGIGKKGQDNGALLLISRDEREARIEVGYGLEPVITDIESAHIISDVLVPAFQAGDYDGGVSAAVKRIESDIRAGAPQDTEQVGQSSQGWAGFIPAVFFFIVFLGSVLARSKSWWAGGVIGGVIGLIFFQTLLMIGILVAVGLLFDYVVSKSYRESIGRGGKPPWWIGGGGFGGGRGGGGFGGFGGGMSGGGGASGRW